LILVADHVLAQAPGAYPQQAYAQPYPQQGFPAQAYPQQPVPQQPYAQPYPQQPLPQQSYPPQQAYPAQQQFPQAYPQQPGAYGYAPGYPGQFAGPPPSAALVSSVDGVLQFGVGSSIVQYVSTSFTLDPGDAKTSRSVTNWGFAENPFVLEGGYGLSSQLLLGGVIQLGGTSNSDMLPNATAPNKISAFKFLLGPKLDYQFMPESKLNPFAGAVLGLGLDSRNEYGAKESRTVFTALVRGGVRYFVFDSVSIDPALNLGFTVGSGSLSSSGVSVSASTSGFLIGLNVGVSFWLK
jgi:hypothetical protein